MKQLTLVILILIFNCSENIKSIQEKSILQEFETQFNNYKKLNEEVCSELNFNEDYLDNLNKIEDIRDKDVLSFYNSNLHKETIDSTIIIYYYYEGLLPYSGYISDKYNLVCFKNGDITQSHFLSIDSNNKISESKPDSYKAIYGYYTAKSFVDSCGSGFVVKITYTNEDYIEEIDFKFNPQSIHKYDIEAIPIKYRIK